MFWFDDLMKFSRRASGPWTVPSDFVSSPVPQKPFGWVYDSNTQILVW